MTKTNLWDNLLEPINPHLCVLLGLLDILYGFWALLPQANDPSVVYPFLDHLIPSQTWGLVLLILGVILVLIHKYFRVKDLITPMAINGVIWAVMSALVFAGDWHANVWILMGFVSIYSLFVAANFKTNFDHARYKRKKKRKFVLFKRRMI